MELRPAIEKMKLYLFDMDGTLYLGDQLCDFTIELLAQIRRTGGQYMFMTNNSSRSVADYVKRLGGFGIQTTPEDFMNASQATAHYLHKHHEGKRLYVCGTESLKEELRGEGFAVTTNLDEVDCIVMGFDTELTYQKLRDVSYLLSTRPELPYIATNLDLACPTDFGRMPDCGSICGMIYNATGKKPIVIGKPSPLMPELAMAKLGISKEETCVVGDWIDSDVKSGLNAGCVGILLMSGNTTPEILAQSPVKPHLVLESAREILDVLKTM